MMGLALWSHVLIGPDCDTVDLNGGDVTLTHGVYATPVLLAAEIQTQVQTVLAGMTCTWASTLGTFTFSDPLGPDYSLTLERRLAGLLGYAAGAHAGNAGNNWTITSSSTASPWLAPGYSVEDHALAWDWDSPLRRVGDQYHGRPRRDVGHTVSISTRVDHADLDEALDWLHAATLRQGVSLYWSESDATVWAADNFFGVRTNCTLLNAEQALPRVSRPQLVYDLHLELGVLDG